MTRAEALVVRRLLELAREGASTPASDRYGRWRPRCVRCGEVAGHDGACDVELILSAAEELVADRPAATSLRSSQESLA